MEITEQALEEKLRVWYQDAHVVLGSGSQTLPVSGILISKEFQGQADLHRSQAVRKHLEEAFGNEAGMQIYLEPITPEESVEIEAANEAAA